MEEVLLSAMKRIKGLKEDLNPFAYLDGNWWIIAVDDYDFYFSDEGFKKLASEIRKEIKELGHTVIFVYLSSSEKTLKQIEKKFGKIIIA